MINNSVAKMFGVDGQESLPNHLLDERVFKVLENDHQNFSSFGSERTEDTSQEMLSMSEIL